jgi:hypothetical protein
MEYGIVNRGRAFPEEVIKVYIHRKSISQGMSGEKTIVRT